MYSVICRVELYGWPVVAVFLQSKVVKHVTISICGTVVPEQAFFCVRLGYVVVRWIGGWLGGLVIE